MVSMESFVGIIVLLTLCMPVIMSFIVLLNCACKTYQLPYGQTGSESEWDWDRSERISIFLNERRASKGILHMLACTTIPLKWHMSDGWIWPITPFKIPRSNGKFIHGGNCLMVLWPITIIQILNPNPRYNSQINWRLTNDISTLSMVP